jgi:hypothetical protein
MEHKQKQPCLPPCCSVQTFSHFHFPQIIVPDALSDRRNKQKWPPIDCESHPIAGVFQ